MEDLASRQRLMQTLEARGLLDRAVEFLPDDVEIAERRRRMQALTRPELAVLLAYAKLTLYSDMLETSVPDDPYLGKELIRYFPEELSQRFPEELEHHRLRREIIATYLTNSIINRGGPSLIARMTDETGAPVDKIAKAFAAVRDSYNMVELNGEIDALDNKISGKLQLDLYGVGEVAAARPHGLVHPQCRSRIRGWPRWSSISAAASRRWRAASTRRCRRMASIRAPRASTS